MKNTNENIILLLILSSMILISIAISLSLNNHKVLQIDTENIVKKCKHFGGAENISIKSGGIYVKCFKKTTFNYVGEINDK